MKKTGFIIVLLIIVSCKKSDNSDFFSTKFKIDGNVESSTKYEKIYLNYIIGNEFILMDSAVIKNNKFTFKGFVNSPKKAQLQFYPNGAFFPFILYGENSQINVDQNDFLNSTITHSEINYEWAKLKSKSQNIYGAIDYLYPLVQKSRIQNDIVQLYKIKNQIDSIESVNRKFLLDYIRQNPQSKLNGLILNDLYSQIKNDSLEIVTAAEKLPIEMQKTLIFKTSSK